MKDRPKTRWLRKHSLTLVAALGGAAGVAYAAGWHGKTTPPISNTSDTRTTVSVVKHEVQPPPAPVPEPVRDTATDTVQIALILDTSSSMDGLINQARSHLWTMVDQMGKLTRVVDGKTRGVKIQLALYEYGNDTLSGRAGFIRQVQPFTGDLDKVSEKLHALFTNGGSEFVGQAIQVAATNLQWSSNPDTMKFVFVAGNEEFDQGPITASEAMKAAAAKGINVQLIYCGQGGGRDETWASAAKLAKSDLMSIDQNHVAAYVPAPQDAEILALGNELNTTYLAYGAEGASSMARQSSADAQSAKMSPKVALERMQLKGKKAVYDNRGWDVIDATTNNAKFFEQTPDAQLPAELRGKTIEEKKQLVAARIAKRTELQGKIAKLEAERSAFLQADQAKQHGAAVNSLETELMKGTKKIAAAKGYKL
jgi:hypothetical protein